MEHASSTPSPDLTAPAVPLVGSAHEHTARRPAHGLHGSGPHTPLTFRGMLDVVALVVATPIVLLAGVPARGYLIGASAWIVLRALGVLIDRVAQVLPRSGSEIGLRLAYLLGRLFGLAVIVVYLRQDVGRDAALTALLVILFAFTTEFIISIIYRPRRR